MAGGLILLFVSTPAQAVYTCSVVATDIAFGAYSIFGSVDVDSIGSITVDCSRVSGSDTFRVDVAIGTGSSGTFSPRNMASGGSTLGYNVYKRSNHTRIWGDGTGGTSTKLTKKCRLKPSKPTCSKTLTVYGRIPFGQNVAAGSYADTLVVTITF